MSRRAGGAFAGLLLTYLAAQWAFFAARGLRPDSFLIYGFERGDWGLVLGFVLAVLVLGLGVQSWIGRPGGLQLAVWTRPVGP